MYNRQIPKINETISKTGKAIVALGCSFVQAQGAIDDALFENYEWEYLGMGHPLRIKVDKKQAEELIKKYPELRPDPDHKINFVDMEYKNSFVNVLCKKYFEGEYAPINLGIRGCGNRATIKELYFRPEINWDKIKELIVIYVPSGIERFDFVNDAWEEHFHWKAMWPNPVETPSNCREHLWEGYNKGLYSEKFGIIEQIGHMQELLNFCKLKNAKLIVTPGFDRRYDKEYFEGELSYVITRDMNGTLKEKHFPGLLQHGNNHKNLAELWPWDTMFCPKGHKTFIDLSMSQEPSIADKSDFFFQFLGNRTPNGWVTACAHPGAKAHDYFAKALHERILEK